MIPPSGTFEYEAEFTSESFKDSDVVVHGSCIRRMEVNRLVGPNPMLRFWNDRLVLVASEKSNSPLRNFSFPIGNAVSLLARPGDLLSVVRTGSGGIGLSLLRAQQLILAIGAVTAVPLGMNLQVDKRPQREDGLFARVRDRWLEFHLQSEHLELRDREVSAIGDYQIYVERCWADGIPGTDECVAMSILNSQAMNTACLRSAILLGNGYLKLTRWDGTENIIQG